MRDAINLVFRVQNTWPPQRIANCKINLVDKTLGIKIPVTLRDTDQDEANHSTVGPDIFENRAALDVLISGKGITELDLSHRIFHIDIYW